MDLHEAEIACFDAEQMVQLAMAEPREKEKGEKPDEIDIMIYVVHLNLRYMRGGMGPLRYAV
jgi:hypothetical protein